MNTKQIISTIAITIVIVGAITLVARPGSSKPVQQSSGGALAATEKLFNFGTISMGNGKVAHSYNVVNDGSGPVRVSKIYTSCMCTSALLKTASGKTFGPFGMPGHGGVLSAANVEVAPGETLTLEAVFDPAAHGPSGVGLVRRTVYIETNSSKSLKLELEFEAVVTP